jgi:Sulfotransferase domain
MAALRHGRAERARRADARASLRGDRGRPGRRRGADRRTARDRPAAARERPRSSSLEVGRPLAPRPDPRPGRGRRTGGGRAAARARLRRIKRLPAELIPRIPRPLRAVLRNAVWTSGRLTSFARPLPDFLILGAQKAGTTALYAYLRWHPQITGPSWKEVSYFDRHYGRGGRWYRGHFPARSRGRVVGEASPGYLFHPLAPQRVAETVPDAKLIALLRDPVDRALSHYHHEVALGREPLSFEDAVAAEPERTRGEEERLAREPGHWSPAWWDHTYLARGRYAEQLERWLAVFPREQLLVLASEELAADPSAVYASVLEFLGVRAHDLDAYPRVYEQSYAEMRADTRRRLVDHFAEPNRRLYELLGRDFGWQAY